MSADYMDDPNPSRFRITSYNVCYTKLLRQDWRSLSILPDVMLTRLEQLLTLL